jgi:hypothetical protein
MWCTLHRVSTLLTWVGSFAFQRADQGRLLTADVATSTDVNMHCEIETTAENVRPQIPFFLAVFDRFAQPLCRFMVFRPNKNVGYVCLQCVGGQNHALDQLVRIALHQESILKSARFHFVGIANEVFVPVGIRCVAYVFHRHEAPLHTGGEARAATSAQVGVLDDLKTVGGRRFADRTP